MLIPLSIEMLDQSLETISFPSVFLLASFSLATQHKVSCISDAIPEWRIS
jgi:hypothetical protein